MSQVVVRAAWRAMSDADLRASFDGLQARADAETPRLKLRVHSEYHQRIGAPTLAESYGHYVRERFALYESILKAMTVSREWTAIVAHSRYHADRPGFTDVDDDWQIAGKFFDPLMLAFPWVDNTMERDWTPWTWEVDLLAGDLDDAHYFSCAQALIVSTGDELRFHGFAPAVPADLRCFTGAVT